MEEKYAECVCLHHRVHLSCAFNDEKNKLKYHLVRLSRHCARQAHARQICFFVASCFALFLPSYFVNCISYGDDDDENIFAFLCVRVHSFVLSLSRFWLGFVWSRFFFSFALFVLLLLLCIIASAGNLSFRGLSAILLRELRVVAFLWVSLSLWVCVFAHHFAFVYVPRSSISVGKRFEHYDIHLFICCCCVDAGVVQACHTMDATIYFENMHTNLLCTSHNALQCE